jgi:K+-transporting ATPase ATPase C chain
VERNGKVVGSAIIGQNFVGAKYFHGRPSALMGTDPKDASKQVPTPYDASESGASNLAPTSKALLDRVRADVGNYGALPVPGDAVTSSASGLDPDMSPENAYRQAPRVATARSLPAATVNAAIAAHTETRIGGVLGAPRVNVLMLNLALDAAVPKRAPLARNDR